MSTTEHPHTDPADPVSAPTPHRPGIRAPRPTWWQAIAAAVGAGCVANLLILALGGAAGASFTVLDAGAPHQVTAAGVVTFTAVPLAVGMAAAALLGRWRAWFVRLAQVVGGGLALLSAAGPLSADTDPATRAALALMHVLVAVVVVLGLEVLRRRAVARAAAPPRPAGYSTGR